MLKVQQAQMLKGSSMDMSMGEQDSDAPDAGPTKDSKTSQNNLEGTDLAKMVVENRSTDQLVIEDGSIDQLNK